MTVPCHGPFRGGVVPLGGGSGGAWRRAGADPAEWSRGGALAVYPPFLGGGVVGILFCFYRGGNEGPPPAQYPFLKIS